MGELITVDGFPLTGVTREGVWSVNSPMPGWFNRPAPKTRDEPRPRGDGGFVTPVEYGTRYITINGMVQSRSHDYLHEAEMRLNALAFRGGVKMLVQGHGATQWATVQPRSGSEPEFDYVTDQLMRFQLPFEAIDPFKYGESYAPSGAIGSPFDVYHRGNVPAWPVITVSGSLPGGYEFSLGPRLVTVSRAVTSGSPHTVDMRTGILRVGGSVARGGIGYSELFAIQPGLPQNFYSLPAGGGSGTVTVRYNDTYI